MSNKADREQESDQDTSAAMIPRGRSMADLTGELSVEYVKPADLAGHRVMLLSGRIRVGQYGEEAVFEVQYIDGTNKGCTATVTLGNSLVRERLVGVVRKYGVVGPVALKPVGEPINGNRAWGFVPADNVEEALPF